jgi:hypothetical protein
MILGHNKLRALWLMHLVLSANLVEIEHEKRTLENLEEARYFAGEGA